MKKRPPAVALMPAAALLLVLAPACGGPEAGHRSDPRRIEVR